VADQRFTPDEPEDVEPIEEVRARPVRRRKIRRDPDAVETLIPYRNAKALLAYYLGVFGLIPILGLLLGPLALIFGILGLSYSRTYPSARGGGHAITGIVLGSLDIVINVAILVLIVLGILAVPRR
jgi:hypothetical protein